MLKLRLDSPFWPLDRLTDGTIRHGATTENSVVRSRMSSHADFARLPAISGDECARVLERCGLVRFEVAVGVIWMEYGAAFVPVPQCDVVPVETLYEILTMTGLSTDAFVEELDRLSVDGLPEASPSSKGVAR
jgi:hypothetical protein